MADDIEIKCIRKQDRQNPHERIQAVGGVNGDGSRWRLPLDQAIKGVLDEKWRFFTYGGGRYARVIVAYHNGHPYLKTEADGIQPDNLLALPECP